MPVSIFQGKLKYEVDKMVANDATRKTRRRKKKEGGARCRFPGYSFRLYTSKPYVSTEADFQFVALIARHRPTPFPAPRVPAMTENTAHPLLRSSSIRRVCVQG